MSALMTAEQATNLLANYPCCKLGKGKKYPTYKEWQNKPQSKLSGCGAGILCGVIDGFAIPIYGFDADIISDAAAEAYAAIVARYMPYAPKRIGLAPKSLIPFVLAGDEVQPLTKDEFTTKTFFPAGDSSLESDKCQLEVLGQGQQFVAYHIPPDSKQPYYWLNSELYDLSSDQLPVLARTQLAELKAEFEKVMVQFGFATPAPKTKPKPVKVPVAAKPADVASACSIASVGGYVSEAGYQLPEVLCWLPNRDLEYDEWQTIVVAIHKVTNGTGELEAHSWSSNSIKHDDNRFYKTWNSSGSYSGIDADWGALIFKAKANGMPDISIIKTNLLMQKADEVSTYDEYTALTQEVSNDKYLPNDAAEVVAKSLHTAYGKAAGISITTIRKAVTPKRETVTTYGLFKGWVFIEAQNKYYDIDRKVAVSAQAFSVRFDGHDEVVQSGNSNAVAYASFQNIRTVYDTMFWPGAGAIFEHKGSRYINTYQAPDLDVPSMLSAEQQKAADSFHAHLSHIFPDESDRLVVLDWMAYLIQEPHVRIHYALLIKGTEGDGKSYLGNVLQAMTRSVNQVAGSSIGGQFNGWAHGARIVVVEEVRVSGDKKYESLDRMKPLISNSEISIEEKGRDIRTVPNFSSYMLFTNHADAMPLNKSDRRYAVLETRFESEDQLFLHHGGADSSADYFEVLFNLLDNYPEAYAHVLLNHKISDSFKPKGRAPHTKAKARMLEASKPEPQRLLEDAIEKHSCDRICKDLLDVTYLNACCTDQYGNMTTRLPKTRAMSGALRDMGYKQIDGARMKIGGVNRYIWYNYMFHDDWSAREAVKRAVEEYSFDDI